MALLTRNAFRDLVMNRNNGLCQVPQCRNKAVDAHHIIERALWTDFKEFGGYFADNGCALCEEHHKAAEANIISPEACRYFIKAKTRLLPRQLDPTKSYNKWGEEISSPTRQGLDIKYPSTPYLDISETQGNPTLTTESLLNCPLVVSVKMDGANVKLTRDKVASRNGDHANQQQFAHLKSLHAGFKHLIPPTIVIFAEWLKYKHSIHYTGDNALSSPLMIFGAYDTDRQLFLGLPDLIELGTILGMTLVPILGVVTYNKPWELVVELTTFAQTAIGAGHEGIVVRPVYPIHYGQFDQLIGKYVRSNHLQIKDVHHLEENELR